MILLRSFGCQIQHRRKLRVQGKVRKQKKTLNSFAPAQTKVSLALTARGHEIFDPTNFASHTCRSGQVLPRLGVKV
jgi:hypothetical protein